ncbi:MAG TPA: BON domain-containing protein [Vicinamibacterales bacterium]|nr:BON domain-containing protein [Vicinamibacterales bacterium]
MRQVRTLVLTVLVVALMVPLLLAGCGKSVGETIDDATITTRVKTALLNDPDVGGLRIDVDTTMGVVSLSGVARTRSEEQQAVAVARRIPGVKDVRSTLVIEPEKK